MRLPHRAQPLRPSKVIDDYGDEVDGPLAAHGDPFAAWLQTSSSTEVTSEGVSVIVSRHRLHARFPGPSLLEGDVIEVDEARYSVEGDVIRPVNPRGRGRYVYVDLKAVSRGGARG